MNYVKTNNISFIGWWTEQILVPIPPPIPIPDVAKVSCQGAEQIEQKHMFDDFLPFL